MIRMFTFILTNSINRFLLIFIYIIRNTTTPIKIGVVLNGKWNLFLDQPSQHRVVPKLAH